MSSSNTALFVIDVQHHNASDPATEVPDAASIRDIINKVLDHARAIPATLVVHVQHDDSNPEEGLYPGKEGWELVFKPDEENGEWHYRKTVGNAFESNPGLGDRLDEEGITELVFCGIQTECCVRASALGAVDLGFDVTLLSGAHSTYPKDGQSIEEIKEVVERELDEKGVEVVPWDIWAGDGCDLTMYSRGTSNQCLANFEVYFE